MPEILGYGDIRNTLNTKGIAEGKRGVAPRYGAYFLAILSMMLIT